MHSISMDSAEIVLVLFIFFPHYKKVYFSTERSHFIGTVQWTIVQYILLGCLEFTDLQKYSQNKLKIFHSNCCWFYCHCHLGFSGGTHYLCLSL